MAQTNNTVYLGYEEDAVPERNVTLLNYTINKIGGFPDWPPIDNIDYHSKCPLCGLHRFLVVQCYAPIDSSPYHRTLYVIACVSPNCWNQSDSWICLRSQLLDQTFNTACTGASVAMPIDTSMAWCSGADEWDENDNGDVANGNIMSVDNYNHSPANNSTHRSSDEDDESNSLDVDVVEQAMGGLQMFDTCNANMSRVQVGAEGAAETPAAAAELEGGEEPGLVTVDTPNTPVHDLQALLNQTAELPVDIQARLKTGPLQFVPKYMYVEQESHVTYRRGLDDRVEELLSKYKRENDEGAVAGGGDGVGGAAGGVGGGGDEETYEEALPLHGDKLFHSFLTRLRLNPGQILRYTRGAPPLLGAPLPPAPPPPTRCQRCGARNMCELQLLPSFTSALHLPGVKLAHLQFLSVLVFTCAQSCWNEGDAIVEESVVFQPEIL